MTDTKNINLKNKKVAIIGCGGLGCNVAVHVCGFGIGTVFICDFDKVSSSNLNRQFLYTENDIGKDKVQVAYERLRGYNSDIDFIPINKKVESANDLSFALDCDIVFLAVDNNETRKIVNDFCAEKGIALVNGGINELFGTVYLYVPGKSPCLSCAGLLEESTKEIVSLSSTAGIIGSLEAEIGLKYLLDSQTEAMGVLHIYDNSEISKIRIKQSSDCSI